MRRSRPSRFRCPMDPTQLGDRGGQFLALAFDRADLLFHVVGFLFGAQVDRPHLLAFLELALQRRGGLSSLSCDRSDGGSGKAGLAPRRSRIRSATVPQAWLACCNPPSARTASSRDFASAASAARARGRRRWPEWRPLAGLRPRDGGSVRRPTARPTPRRGGWRSPPGGPRGLAVRPRPRFAER